jgi:hypothetical protein
MNEAEQRALLAAWSVLDDVMTEPDCFDPRKVSLGTLVPDRTPAATGDKCT